MSSDSPQDAVLASLPDARLRLAFLNQNREWALGGLLGLAVAARLFGVPVSATTLALLGAWFAAAAALARVGADPGSKFASGAGLRAVEILYCLFELGVITWLARANGAAAWLVLLFYLVTILYALMILPARHAGLIAGLAAASFTTLLATRWIEMAAPVRWTAFAGLHHPVYLTLTVVILALGGYGLVGATLSQFSRMLNGHTLALQSANAKLAATSQELRQHRIRLEAMVRERTDDLQSTSDELRRANRELQRVNRLKSNFLANVSHELRTPLTSIRSFSEILLDYPNEDVFTRTEFLEIIMSESDRLTRLINDVLDLAKIEAGKMEWRREPVRVASVVAPALESIRLIAEHRGLQLLNLIPPDLPPVYADPDRLRQVFTNLLSNAVKFTPSGTIQVGALERRPGTADAPGGRHPEVVVFVADSGVGIPAHDLEHIFEKFHQNGGSRSGKPAGTGLGLSICKEIMAHLGGRIWAESEPHRGSVFYCALPAAASGAAHAPIVLQPAPRAQDPDLVTRPGQHDSAAGKSTYTRGLPRE